MYKSLALIWIGLSLPALACYGQPRASTLLESGWRFELGDVDGAAQPAFDDHAWEPVVLPHNWGWEEAQKGQNYYREPGGIDVT